MLKAILAAVVLVLLFARDVRLLVSAGPNRITVACSVYSGLFVSYAVAVTQWLTTAHVQRPDRINLAKSVWIGIVSVHVLFGGLTWLISSRAFRRSAWVIALAPSPAIYLCLCLFAGALPDRIDGALGVMSLLLFSVIWIALIAPLASELAHGPLHDRFASRGELRSAALLNLSSIVCLSMVLMDSLEGGHR